MNPLLRYANEVDILMIAEGTYPFVRGGVASWIHDMVTGLPSYRFGIIFLGETVAQYDTCHYPVPDNVVYLDIIGLFEHDMAAHKQPKAVHDKAVSKLDKLHHNFKCSHFQKVGLAETLPSLNALMSSEKGMDLTQFLRSDEAFSMIAEAYEDKSATPSFIDYFWHVRNIHIPLWHLSEYVKKVPKCKVIHPISTGYAGFLSVLLHQHNKQPIVLSEHGLYTKERDIELLQTGQFDEKNTTDDAKLLTYHHQLWGRFFDSLGRMTYAQATTIVSLYQSARMQQCQFGADIAKTTIVPNGIAVERFSPYRKAYAEDRIVIGFVGRFVRIKDIKSFIMAIQHLKEMQLHANVLINMVGEPDNAYLTECQQLIQLLKLTDTVAIVKEKGMPYMLSESSVLVLSSISEGMPLVMLEAMAAGVPVVATDVGACASLIEGDSYDDKALGVCGRVVRVASPMALAEAIYALVKDKKTWMKASAVAIKRIDAYYQQDKMLNAYTHIYEELISKWQA
jgi:glycosyltransferase involved in cell wall biosynthesis